MYMVYVYVHVRVHVYMLLGEYENLSARKVINYLMC